MGGGLWRRGSIASLKRRVWAWEGKKEGVRGVGVSVVEPCVAEGVGRVKESVGGGEKSLEL